MSGTFDERLDELAALIGAGDLVGEVEVNQIYAHFQHEHLEFRHPRGGQAKYLEAPLVEGAAGFFQRIADEVLDVGPVKPMVDNVEHLSDQVKVLAPLDLNNLRRSAHPTVVDDDQTVYDRAAEQPRLSEAELRALHAGQRHPYG